ncbi:hypothetical protein BDD12DRAFT_863033, partial [Trichophaea hybrida]
MGKGKPVSPLLHLAAAPDTLPAGVEPMWYQLVGVAMTGTPQGRKRTRKSLPPLDSARTGAGDHDGVH